MTIPNEVQSIIEKLQKSGYEAYIVGGCVRDFLIGIEPDDWDITTNAKPEEIQKLFLKSSYKNKFLTVTVLTNSKNPKLKEVEITTYRKETKYTDKRHPDEVKFAKTIEEDLARRDFTINAIAIACNIKPVAQKVKKNTRRAPRAARYRLVDLFDGQKDLKNKIIRTVGNPNDRFNEDALRIMRAIRFTATLNFILEKNTLDAIKKNAGWLRFISKERIRDEFLKIIMSENASEGVEMLRETGLLKYIIPEIEQGYEVKQNKHHIYDCYQHSLFSLKYAAKKGFNKYVRLAALLHDVGKPKTKRGEGPDATFYGHEIVGAKMTSQILNRLKFSKKDRDKIVKLVRYHLFYYNVGEVSESSVRRLVRNAGIENMEELLQVRQSDRIGSGVPKAEPYKLRHLKYIIEKVSRDPISVKMLKVKGNDIIRILKIQPGPKIGRILDILLFYVLEDPEKNEKIFLEKEIEKLGNLPEEELIVLAQKAKREREKMEIKKDEMTKKKYWVM